MSQELHKKISSAAKWSAIGEVMAKLVTPISTVVLARLLTPQAFGVVATITMIISFAEIFMDGGFQRYVIQREYESDKEKFKVADVAYWTNLVIGLFLFVIICIFNEPLARLVGNPGLGNVLIVAAIAIPVNAMTSIQMAVFKHSLDFKSLFYRRIVTVLVPLAITIPLAFLLRSYWALVIGTLASNIITATVLTIFSPWRPTLYYNIGILKGMIGYSSWSLADALLIWASTYIEIFFIGIILNDYYLGLYKTAMTTVGQFVSIISAIILPILMPAFSRTQHDYSQMRGIIYKLQEKIGMIILPLGGFIFVFREQITNILLGNQWNAIATFIGIWAIAEVVMLLFQRFCSNIYPAINKPHISVIIQILYLIVLVPAVYISARISFEALYWTRTLIRVEGLLVNWYFAYRLIKLNPLTSLNVVKYYIIVSAVSVLFFSQMLKLWDSDWSILLWGSLYSLLYLASLFIFPSQRNSIIMIWKAIVSHVPILNTISVKISNSVRK